MHVMIATDGTLDIEKTVSIASKLAAGGTVTVYTAVEVPRGMLDEMRSAASDPADTKAREIASQFPTTQADTPTASHWVGDDAVVARYVKAKVAARSSDLVAALKSEGIEPTVVGEEGENAARTVLAAAASHGADVLCIGTHGQGRFEGLLGSLSTKIARLAPCSVVLIR